MIKPVLRTAWVTLLVAAVPVRAELISDASIERYIADHQDGCVATLDAQVQSAGYALPFGFVDNFCHCMGTAMFSGMTVAQEQELQTATDGKLPERVMARQAQIRNECAASTTDMYAADLQDTSN